MLVALFALVGTTTQKIVAEAQSLLDDPVAYAAMVRGVSPYGDGQASQRITDILTRNLARSS
ncbi:MAG: UDP-N-acetylglucosamine 2-epimerase [Rhizobiaceae bacterium]|nr:UDP-N-acetylglucosamine 2-epimerase [Rhizobiaceae bacterium]